MANLREYLELLAADPGDEAALAALVAVAEAGGEATASALAEARRRHLARGDARLGCALFDLELCVTPLPAARAALLVAKAEALHDELFDIDAAVAALTAARSIVPDDAEVEDRLEELELVRASAPRLVEKYLAEAIGQPDAELRAALLVSAAETMARQGHPAATLEPIVVQALDAFPGDLRAVRLLARIYEPAGRAGDVVFAWEAAAEVASTVETRIDALAEAARLAHALGREQIALGHARAALALEPTEPRALRVLVRILGGARDWAGVVAALTLAQATVADRVPADPEAELALILHAGLVLWHELGDVAQAEALFRRARLLDPTRPVVREFFAARALERGPDAVLAALLRRAESAQGDARRDALVEAARVAEAMPAQADRAAELWRQAVRGAPPAVVREGRSSLKRLLAGTRRWNALLELLKEDLEQHPMTSPEGREGRAAVLFEMARIYDEGLGLDAQAVSALTAILALVPDHPAALDALAARYEAAGRWNDLVGVLQRKADASRGDPTRRIAVLRRLAAIWSERFGNHAQAVRPLEELVAADPGDADASQRLKEVYARRRQWRALLDLLAREALTLDGAAKRAHVVGMAQIAADRLGDVRAAIALWNRVLEVDDRDAEALATLCALYEREKRWLGLAEALGRLAEVRHGAADAPGEVAALEKLAQVLVERLAAPGVAIDAVRRLLVCAPDHPRARRVLRELLVQAGDVDALEREYTQLGALEELAEILLGRAEREEAPAARRALLQRVVRIADAVAPERALRARERLFALDPDDVAVAEALLPVYRQAEKWQRVVAVGEALVRHRTGDARLQLVEELRQACEDGLGSNALAFKWALQAYELVPDPAALASVLRLGTEAEAWDELEAVLARRAGAADLGTAERTSLLVELGKLRTRLGDRAGARAAWEQLLAIAPEHLGAQDGLEELLAADAKFAELAALIERRAAQETRPDRRIDRLQKVAFIQEERLGDAAAAARTLVGILAIEPRHTRAIRSLGRLAGVLDDPRLGVQALELELQLANVAEERAETLVRIGRLREDRLGDRAGAFLAFREALRVHAGSKGAVLALERALTMTSPDDAAVPAPEAVSAASLLVPIFDRPEDAPRLAACLELLRTADPKPEGRLALDRLLLPLYARKLRDPRRAYVVAARIFDSAPDDAPARGQLLDLGAEAHASADVAARLEAMRASIAGDPERKGLRRTLALELARLHEERLGNPVAAEAAWREVLELSPDDGGRGPAWVPLEKLLRAGTRWTELAALHEARIARAGDQGTRREAMLALAELAEGQLGELPRAIEAWQGVRELMVDPTRADRALEKLYERAGRWADLDAHLAGHVGRAKVDQVDLAVRRAELRLRELDDPEGGLELIARALASDPRHPGARALALKLTAADRPPAVRSRAAQLLGPILEQEAQWPERAGLLLLERELATTTPERLGLTVRVAQLQAERLGDRAAAFDTWREALLLDPADGRARQALPVLGPELGRGEEVAIAWETAAERIALDQPGLAAELYGELAALAEDRLGSPDRASAALARKLTLASASGDRGAAREAAFALLERRSAWDELARMLRDEAGREPEPAQRAPLFLRLAEVETTRRNDPRAAAAAWVELLALEPSSEPAITALEQIYEARGEWRELEGVLRRRLDAATTDVARCDVLGRITRLLADRLGVPDEALEPARELASLAPTDPAALAEVARLERRLQRWDDLVETLERQLSIATEAGVRALVSVELATLAFDHLDRTSDGLAWLAEVLEAHPEAARVRGEARTEVSPELAAAVEALAMVEARAKDPDLAPRVEEILEPLYRAAGDAGRLVALLERRGARAGDGQERAATLLEAAAVRETQLGQLDAAFDDACAAARLLRADSEVATALALVQRLAGEHDRIPELFALYREIAVDVVDSDLQRRIYLDLGDLARGRLGDRALAKDFYRRVLDAHPDDARAVAALEAVHRELGEHEDLAEMLLRRAHSAGDLDARKAAYAERAALAEGALARPDDATLAWTEVLEIDPSDRVAQAALERLHERAERWHELVALLERRLGFVATDDEALALQLRLAQLHEEKLSDPEGGLEAYAAVLAASPGHAVALAAVERLLDDPIVRAQAAQVLEPIYAAAHDWPKLVGVAEARLEAETDPLARARLLRRVARLVEDQLEDLDGAFQWTARIVREEPADRQARDQLVRLATVLERWDELASLCEETLETDPPVDVARDLARLAAEVRDRRLTDVDKARTAWKRVLELDPEDASAFGRLEALLTRHARWPELVEDYDGALEAAFDPKLRKDLLLRRARVWEEELGKRNRAISSLEAARDLDPDDAALDARLVRLYTQDLRWADVIALHGDRIARAASAADTVTDRLAIAELEERERDDGAAAADQLEAVLEAVPGHPVALAGLERLVLDARLKERLLDVLEPEYRRADAWQKLVVVLAEQLALAPDSGRRVELGREIAMLHETRGGNLAIALRSRARAWFEDPRDEDLLGELTGLGERMAAWGELIGSLEAGAAELDDPVWASELLGRAAVIEEQRQRSPERAASLWRQVLARLEDDPNALAELARLEAAAGHWDEVGPLLERRHGAADDPAERRALLAELARVEEQRRARPAAALAAWRRVLEADPEDAEALAEVLRLERTAGTPATLADAIDHAIARASVAEARATLRREVAALREGPLEDPAEAAAQQRALLEDRPDDPRALDDLERLLVRLGVWPELIELLDRRAPLAPTDAERVEIQHRAARAVEVELGEPADALGRYEAILARAPDHAATRAAVEALLVDDETAPRAAAVLEPLYEAAAAADPWVALLERKLALPALDDADRRAVLVQLATVHEWLRQDLAAGWATWARLLTLVPDDAEALAALERMAGAQGRWKDLATLLEERSREVDDDRVGGDLAWRAARVQEDALAELPEAARLFRAALDRQPDGPREDQLLVAMARVLERLGRWTELEEIIERQAALADDPEVGAALWARVGEVRERHRNAPAAAIEAYREAVGRQGTQPLARAALDRFAREGERALRVDALDVLEPLVEAEGAPGPHADVITLRADLATEPGARATAWRHVAELREAEGDLVSALDACAHWLSAEPTSEDAAGALERLAKQTGRWNEAAASLADILRAPGATSGDDAERALAPRLARILVDELKDHHRAEPWARRAAALEPDDPAALLALETVYRSLDDAPRLAEVLGQRAALVLDPSVRRALLLARARLIESRLSDGDASTAAWHLVLDADEADRDAHKALALLHAHAGRWERFVSVLELAARHAPTPAAEAELHRKIATTLAGPLADPTRAVSAWQLVLEHLPGDVRAVDGLAAAERARGDWDGLVTALELRQELATADAERVAVLVELARVHEQERQAPDEAIAIWGRVLEIDPRSEAAAASLARILIAEARWHELADLLDRRAEHAGAAGRLDDELGALLAAADVWETHLSDPDAAAGYHDKILARAPGHPGALLGLARIAELREDWAAAREALERALASGARGADAAALEVRLAGLAARDATNGGGSRGLAERGAEGPLIDAEERAAERRHLERALAHDPSSGPALDGLAAIARAHGDNARLVELLAHRIGQLEGTARTPVLLEAGALLAGPLGRPEDALAPLEEAARLEGEGGAAEEVLAEIYVRAGRPADARPILERLRARAQKDMKGRVAGQLAEKLGQACEALGDTAAALAAYEDAFRVDPTRPTTQTGLGRLYVARSDWDKALRVYRGMLLGALDPASGMSKADVYLAIGKIHAAQGERQKARGMLERGLEAEPAHVGLKSALAGLP